MYSTLVEAVLAHAKENGNQPAVYFKEECLSYEELADALMQGAVALKELGIKEGDRVLVMATSKPEFIVALLAIQAVHAVAVPLNKSAKPESIQELYEFSEASLCLLDSRKLPDTMNVFSLKLFYKEAIEKKKDVRFEYKLPNMTSLAEILFTTGTTGKPKGVMQSYQKILANINNTWHGIGMQENDVILHPLPLNHSFGMRVLRTILYIGASIVLQNGFAFARETENNLKRFQCSGFVCVAAAMEVIYRQAQDKLPEIFGGLRYIEFSAGAVSVDMRKKLRKLLPDVELHNTWGSTETGGALFLCWSGKEDKIASAGHGIGDICVKIVGEDNEEIVSSREHTGRLAISGSMLMDGYYKAEDLTRRSLQDGWLITNDVAYLDDDGYVYLLGRADDIINVGGKKASPVRIESVAQEYEGIRECACIGIEDPDRITGEVPLLYVVPENGSAWNGKDFILFLDKQLEEYELPKKVLFIDEIPKNYVGKTDRKALRAKYEEEGEESLINPVISTILSRRSIRKFTSQEIEKKVLDLILTAAIHAPSGHNLQTWQFSILQKQEEIEKLKTVTKEVTVKKKKILYGWENPKVLILISNDRRNPYGIQDCSCAAQNIFLAAESFGIGSVWLNPLMTICDEPEIRSLLDSYGIPKEHIVWAAVALGYPQEKGTKLAKKNDVIHYVE
ncbi:MAG: AMP-binding protein [Lachnospiraceae bacterium]|nr:AMP-binding protein [Lachnospiraceae bacterium]